MKLNKKLIIGLVKPEAIKELMSSLFSGKFSKEIGPKNIYDVFKQKNYYMFPEYLDGKIIAMTSMYVMELFSRKMAVIEEVVTLEEHRNKGIGSKLVEMAIAKAKELECDCVELNVRQDKPDVSRFYEGLGFKDRSNNAMRLWLKK